MKNTPWIHIKNLWVWNHQKPILENIEFSIPYDKGVSFGLIGESGGGKTTLIKAIGGLLLSSAGFRTSGKIHIYGQNILEISEIHRILRIGREFLYISQNPYSMFDPLVPIGIQLAQAFRAFSGIEAPDTHVMEWLERLDLHPPSEIYVKYPYELSGGMVQRCALIYTAASPAKFIILDEPFSSLDHNTSTNVFSQFKPIWSTRNILVVSHDIRWLEHFVAWIGVIFRGKLVEYGKTEKVLRHPGHPYTRFLLDTLRGNKEKSLSYLKDLLTQFSSVPFLHKNQSLYSEIEENHYLLQENSE